MNYENVFIDFRNDSIVYIKCGIVFFSIRLCYLQKEVYKIYIVCYNWISSTFSIYLYRCKWTINQLRLKTKNVMKTKTIPFDAKMAKDIQDGKIEGKIKTRESKDVDEIVFFRTPLVYNVYAVINGRPHSFTERGFERSWDKSGKWRGDLVIEVPDKPQFKPFDKVLVRNEDTTAWTCAIFSHINNNTDFLYAANSFLWKQCITYEGNEHLVGTTDKPKED